MSNELGEFFGRHGLTPIFGVEFVLLDPVVVD